MKCTQMEAVLSHIIALKWKSQQPPKTINVLNTQRVDRLFSGTRKTKELGSRHGKSPIILNIALGIDNNREERFSRGDKIEDTLLDIHNKYIDCVVVIERTH